MYIFDKWMDFTPPGSYIPWYLEGTQRPVAISRPFFNPPSPPPIQDCRITGTRCQILIKHAEQRFFLLIHKARTDTSLSCRGTAKRWKQNGAFSSLLDHLGTRKPFPIPLYSITWQTNIGCPRKLNFSGCYKEIQLCSPWPGPLFSDLCRTPKVGIVP